MAAMEWITAIVLVLAMGGIGGMKLVGNEEGIEQAIRLGYEKIRIPIGIAEVLSAIGVILGSAIERLEWLGVLSAAGIVAMMIGAFGFHVRARDTFPSLPSLVVGAAAVLYIVAVNAN